MEEIVFSIWSGLASVQAVVEPEEWKAAVATPDEADSVLRAMFKAAHRNCTVDDATAAALAARGASPADVINFDWLLTTVKQYVVKNWLEIDLEASTSGKIQVTTPDSAQDGQRPLNPIEAAVKELADCILDDRDPHPLLPYSDVLTLSGGKSKTLYSSLSTFLTYTVHARIDDAFTRMWTLAGSGAATLTQAQFTRWFQWVLLSLYDNSNPERAAIAARKEWYDLIATNGQLQLDSFVRGASFIAEAYAGEKNATAFYSQLLQLSEEAVAKAGGKLAHTFDALVTPPGREKAVLADPWAIQCRDELDASVFEEKFFRTPQGSSTILVGLQGTAKSSIAAELAAKINAVNIEIEPLAIAAFNDPNDALGATLRELVADMKPVPLPLQAQLVRRVLLSEATYHRGYVFADIPTATEANKDRVEAFLETAGLLQAMPQGIVEVECAAALYPIWAAGSLQAKDGVYAKELALRAEEQAAADKKVADELALNARRINRQQRIERRAKIESGEIQPTEQDQLDMQTLIEDEEEVKAEVDDDGNPLDAETLAARDAARRKQRDARMRTEDLKYLVYQGRRVLFTANQFPILSLPKLAAIKEIVGARHRHLTVGCVGPAADAAEFIVSALKLSFATVPEEPALAEDAEAPQEGPADNDLVLADMKLKVLQENTANAFGKWQKNCAVTYADSNVLVEGSMAYSCVYRRVNYCFASRSKLNRFLASPHPFLIQNFSVPTPMLLMKTTLDVTGQGALQVQQTEAVLAKEFGLTSISFNAYHEKFTAYRDLCNNRKNAEEQRVAADAKTRLGREERLKKRLDAEAKKKKKDDSKKKVERKKKEETAGDPNAAPMDGEGAAAEDAAPPPPVETTAERMDKIIRAAVAQRDDALVPLLVSCLSDISEEQFETLFTERALPPTLILLSYKAPRPPGEEGEEEVPEEEERTTSPPPPAADEEEEEGKPVAKKVVEKPAFDPTNDKQYRRLVTKLAAQIAKSTDQFGTEPEAVEGQPPPKPFQKFNMFPYNTFGKSQPDLLRDLAHAMHPASIPALPPQDGEDITQDPDAEEEEDGVVIRRNPLLIPGPKAIHQFGTVLRYCPVTLRETGTLVAGDPANWLSFCGKKYLFANPDGMEKFKQFPKRFTDGAEIPPPRIWVVGPPSCGKKELSTSVSSSYGLPLFQYGLEEFKKFVAAAETGGSVAGVAVPKDLGTAALQRAKTLFEELAAFDADQQAKIDLKEKTQKEQNSREAARDAGEDIDELDEEEEAAVAKALEFEPEEPEVRDERVNKATRQIAASLTRVEPYNTSGYIMAGHPSSEGELQTLLDEGAYPDIVVSIKLSTETFVARRLKALLKTKYAEYTDKVAAQQEKIKAIQVKTRAVELAKWRRRNIGGDDAPAEEIDELPEEIEAVNEEAVRAELEGGFDAESGTVAAVAALLPERRIQVAELVGDAGKEAVYKSCTEQLRPFLDSRRSLLRAVQVATFDEAQLTLRKGIKALSCFRFHDPVALYDARHDVPMNIVTKRKGEADAREDVIPQPEPPKPKEKLKQLVTKVNDETGEEYQVEEVVEDDEIAEVEEVEPEEELEAEPENSPEELEEMMKELVDKQKVRADALKPKAAILDNRVYFFENSANLIRFIYDPLKFWDQAAPGDNMAVIASVFEDQPSAFDVETGVVNRSMSEQIAYNMEVAVLDAPRLLKWAMLQPRLGQFSARAREFVLKGVQFNDDVVSALLVTRLQCADVRRKGIVLADLPRNPAQLKALSDSNIFINNAFFLRSSDAMQPAISVIADVCRAVTTTGADSMAALVECLHGVEQSRKARQELRLRTDLGFPAPTYNTTTLEATIGANLSKFMWYCPHMWSHKQELVDLRKNRQFCVVFCGKYYSFSSKAYLEDFLVHPETVASDWNGRGQKRLKFLQLPSTLPRHMTETEAAPFVGQLELAGCCPVTLFDTRHNVGLKGITDPTAVKGKPHLISEYASKYYAVISEAAMDRFLKQPWVFADGAVLPHENKLPVEDDVLRASNDDVFLTRAVYENAARAMLAAAKTRPKYPGLSIEESALKFIALHLKANNVKNSDVRQAQYTSHFNAFAQQSVLYKSISTTEPEDEAAKEEFHTLCHAWDKVQDDPTGYAKYNELRTDASAASQH